MFKKSHGIAFRLRVILLYQLMKYTFDGMCLSFIMTCIYALISSQNCHTNQQVEMHVTLLLSTVKRGEVLLRVSYEKPLH